MCTSCPLMTVSKDTDFRLLAFVYGPPLEVSRLCVANVSTAVIEDMLRATVTVIALIEDSNDELFLVLSRKA